MITKAIIQEVIDNYSARVRIPIINKADTDSDATPDSELYVAYISTLPNCKYQLQKGDIVFVAFEDNDVSKPIIIGYLSNENTKSFASLEVDSLQVNNHTTLSENTNIGNVTKKEIGSLSGVSNNIQKQFDLLSETNSSS